MFFELEQGLSSPLPEFCDAFVQSILNSAIFLYAKESFPKLFDIQTYDELMNRGYIRANQMCVEDWVNELLRRVNPYPQEIAIAKLKPLSLQYIRSLLRYGGKRFDDDTFSYLSMFIIDAISRQKPFWLPAIGPEGYEKNNLCRIHARSFKLQNKLDFSDMKLSFYQTRLLPFLCNRFMNSKKYKDNHVFLDQLLESLKRFDLKQDPRFRIYFLKMVFYSINIVSKPSNDTDQFVTQFSSKFVPLLLLFVVLAERSSEHLDLFRKRKRVTLDGGLPFIFKDFITRSILFDLKIIEKIVYWEFLRLGDCYISEANQLIDFQKTKDDNAIRNLLCLSEYKENSSIILKWLSLTDFIQSEC